jgi:replicative DNA helicase
MKGEDDPMEVVHYCRLAAGVYGADYIFIDHVQRLAYLGGIDGATNTLTKIASNLAQLAKELNIGIIMISHVNEDGHTKYAKSLEEEAIVLVKIERDKESTDPDVANTTKFYLTKNRPFSKLGFAGAVKYNPETTLIEELLL